MESKRLKFSLENFLLYGHIFRMTIKKLYPNAPTQFYIPWNEINHESDLKTRLINEIYRKIPYT